MKSKLMIPAVGLVLVLSFGIAGYWTSRPAPTPPQSNHATKLVTTPVATPPTPESVSPTAPVTLSKVKPETPPKDAAAAGIAPAGSALVINGYEVHDPMARVALSFVGSDPEADVYWIGAINDSSLPPEERKDLIEDLNEDGLSNPKRPTPEDRPIIAARLRLIEQLAPNALDEVNRDALAEAYKDLLGLLNGEPPN